MHTVAVCICCMLSPLYDTFNNFKLHQKRSYGKISTERGLRSMVPMLKSNSIVTYISAQRCIQSQSAPEQSNLTNNAQQMNIFKMLLWSVSKHFFPVANATDIYGPCHNETSRQRFQNEKNTRNIRIRS